jgi:hypothetical protein
MSLKAFHVFFIVASIALSFGFGAWSARMNEPSAVRVIAYVLGAGLVVYLIWFVKKTFLR